MARVPIERHGRPRPCERYSKGPALLGRISDSEPFDGTRATGGATDENTNERAPNQKTSGRTGLCPEETTKISILSGRNRFIPDEIQIVDDKDKAHRTAASNHAAHVHAYTQKSPASFHWSDSSKNGGYLLSHLVGQYHRR